MGVWASHPTCKRGDGWKEATVTENIEKCVFLLFPLLPAFNRLWRSNRQMAGKEEKRDTPPRSQPQGDLDTGAADQHVAGFYDYFMTHTE